MMTMMSINKIISKARFNYVLEDGHTSEQTVILTYLHCI